MTEEINVERMNGKASEPEIDLQTASRMMAQAQQRHMKNAGEAFQEFCRTWRVQFTAVPYLTKDGRTAARLVMSPHEEE